MHGDRPRVVPPPVAGTYLAISYVCTVNFRYAE